MLNVNQSKMICSLGIFLLSSFQYVQGQEAEDGTKISSIDGVRIEAVSSVRKSTNRWALTKGQIIAIPRLSVSDEKIQSAISEAKCTIQTAMGSPRPGLFAIDENDKTETPTILALRPAIGSNSVEVLKLLKDSNCFAVVKIQDSAN